MSSGTAVREVVWLYVFEHSQALREQRHSPFVLRTLTALLACCDACSEVENKEREARSVREGDSAVFPACRVVKDTEEEEDTCSQDHQQHNLKSLKNFKKKSLAILRGSAQTKNSESVSE
ncbi:hypothetical protein SRHO_G00151280 [Serrasalmus rhombeus]